VTCASAGLVARREGERGQGRVDSLDFFDGVASVPRQLVSAELVYTKDSGRLGAASGCFNEVIESCHVAMLPPRQQVVNPLPTKKLHWRLHGRTLAFVYTR
jgi:hypothetical protein